MDGVARDDPRALLTVVRALSSFIDQPSARATLVSILNAPTALFSLHPSVAVVRDRNTDDQQGAGRIALAKREAAFVLADCGYLSAQQALVSAAESDGPGHDAASEALAASAPIDPLVIGESTPTPSSIALAGRIGDMRSLTAIARQLRSPGDEMRIAVLSALASLGDARALDAAREAVTDPNFRVRLAAAEVFVRLGSVEAERAIAGLIGDDAAALDALELARHVQGVDVIRAATARAMVSALPEVRNAAIGVLGREIDVSAVTSLLEFMKIPVVEGPALCALSRSPSVAALGAIEAMAAQSATRRNAVRAYLVRRKVRGATSAILDSLVNSLAGSQDAKDRAIGVEALVAFGDRPLSRALLDPDGRVRSAAVMGALGRLSEADKEGLLARRYLEPDPRVREILSNGLIGGGADEKMSTETLVDVVRGGRADALLALGALVRRTDGESLSVAFPGLDESPDAATREQVARALGGSPGRDVVGRLVRALRFESDDRVRRAIVLALSTQSRRDAGVSELLGWVGRFDPDSTVRSYARVPSAVDHRKDRESPREVACLRVMGPNGSPATRRLTATLVDADGAVVAVDFDDDGYAIVPGLSTGDLLVRLAPSLRPYDADSP